MRFILRCFVGALIGISLGLVAKWIMRPKVQKVPPVVIHEKGVEPEVQKRPGIVEEFRESPHISMRGYAVRGDHWNIVLSDGRVVTERDPSAERLTRASVFVDGKRVYMALPEARAREKPVEKVEEKNPSTQVAQTGQVYGSWRVDPDGVSRLVNQETFVIKN